MCTPPAGCALLERRAERPQPGSEVPAKTRSKSNRERPGSPPLAAKTTCCRWYGPPVAVRVVSALAILAATTSARMRSACMASPDVHQSKEIHLVRKSVSCRSMPIYLLSAWMASITRWYSWRNSATPVLNFSCASARFRLSRSMETLFPSGRATSPSEPHVHGLRTLRGTSALADSRSSPPASRPRSPCPRCGSPGVSTLAMFAAVSFARRAARSKITGDLSLVCDFNAHQRFSLVLPANFCSPTAIQFTARPKSISPAVSTGSSPARIAARSSTCSSSRTLPGQSCGGSLAIAS